MELPYLLIGWSEIYPQGVSRRATVRSTETRNDGGLKSGRLEENLLGLGINLDN